VANVRFGSTADMCSAKGHVRFTPESDIKCDIMECPLWAKSGHPSIIWIATGVRVARLILNQPYFNEELLL
jgi:hypothetical protein